MTQHDTYLGRLSRIRERFKRKPEVRSWIDVPRQVVSFFVLSLKKARHDELGRQAASLAFLTLVALIPTLTAFSIVGAMAFESADLVELLAQVLPYPEQTIVDTLSGFLVNTQKLGLTGLLLYVATALVAFINIEETVNRIWNVPDRRPLQRRIVSFTLVTFWGPILLAATYYSLLQLAEQSALGSFAASVPAQFLPFLATLIGLTMLYWLVPYTRVSLKSALGGGVSAAVLLEGLRQGFGLFIAKMPAVSIVYGSLGFIFFFLISIQLTWWIVLLGSEVAYFVENFAALVRPRRNASALEGSWLGLLGLAVVAERFRSGEPITPHELLADRLGLKAADLRDVLRPVIDGGLLRESGGDAEGFLLACDPHELRLSQVFELYEPGHWELMDSLSEPLETAFEELRARLAESRGQLTEGLVLAEVLKGADSAGDRPATGG